MSSYEFWDELGKIFNAVVAYQEKNLEFNKRFISPWIRLGNVFEKQDRNKEAMTAYERAIEIDGENPQNWYELGNIHFKMENHADAVSAFKRAIELDPSFGWAHNNLALTLATMGETEQAVPLYQQAIGLLQDPRDKAVAWNRLGNAYRRLNQYEQALDAFHTADELDRDNSGFRDNMDDVTDGPTLMAHTTAENAGEAAQLVNVSPIELIVADSRASEEQSADEAALPAAAAVVEETAATGTADGGPNAGQPEAESTIVVPQAEAERAQAEPEAATIGNSAEAMEPLPEAEPAVMANVPEAPEVQSREALTETPIQEAKSEESVQVLAEETVTVVVQDNTETFTETLPIAPPTTEAGNAGQDAGLEAEVHSPEELQTAQVVTSDEAVPPEAPAPTLPVTEEAESTELEAAREPEVLVSDVAAVDVSEAFDPAPNSLADQLLEAEPEVLDVSQQVAYEAFLKDTGDSLGDLGTDEEDRPELEAPGSPEPVAKIDESGELQIEMDTKNAHVWNELGNVYFNTAAYDDAIVAYSKAIELDRWFAWPYSNLALAYVQKRRFVEAILLYQRSIELFSTDKDKAISWNRLGNVYRRLNDYENAIAAYQRADALDPDNSTLSLQSRFSLLGNYAMEQKPSYVS
jgi:tetratricopeptide (TPR) repeat protein